MIYQDWFQSIRNLIESLNFMVIRLEISYGLLLFLLVEPLACEASNTMLLEAFKVSILASIYKENKLLSIGPKVLL